MLQDPAITPPHQVGGCSFRLDEGSSDSEEDDENPRKTIWGNKTRADTNGLNSGGRTLSWVSYQAGLTADLRACGGELPVGLAVTGAEGDLPTFVECDDGFSIRTA